LNWIDKGATAGPSTAVDGNVIVFDANLSAIVAWGGVASVTYTWSGTLWSSNATATPTARNHIIGTYDSIRLQVVLFGGNNGLPLTDTWVRNGTAWSQQPALS